MGVGGVNPREMTVENPETFGRVEWTRPKA